MRTCLAVLVIDVSNEQPITFRNFLKGFSAMMLDYDLVLGYVLGTYDLVFKD